MGYGVVPIFFSLFLGISKNTRQHAAEMNGKVGGLIPWKKPEYPAACCRDEGQGGDVYSVDQVRGELCELMLQSRLFSCLEFYLAAFRLLKTQSHLSLNQTNVSVLRS